MSSTWHSFHAPVHVLLEESHIFYVKVHSEVHAQVRTGNLDIIPTSCMAVFMAARRFDGFFVFFLPFFALLRFVPELSASFLGPSMAKSSLPSRAPMPISIASVDMHIRLASARVQNNNNNTPPGAGHRVVVEGLSIRQVYT